MFSTVDDESDGQMMSRMMVMFESMRRGRREVPGIKFDNVHSGDMSWGSMGSNVGIPGGVSSKIDGQMMSRSRGSMRGG
jgi:hypothetical protein